MWVTSYELLRQDIEQYASLRFTCCVLDEGQHIKNQSTLASKAVKRIDCRQRFVMTGTPIENRLSELWNLFDFLMPGYLFSHSGFVTKLEKPAIKSGDKEAMEQLRRMVRPFLLRRMKQDVLKELPPKIEYVRRISLSEEERKVYFSSSAAARQSLESGEGGKMAILAALTELRQICCAPELCFENYEGPSSKLDACIELCAGMVENGHQVLLFPSLPLCWTVSGTGWINRASAISLSKAPRPKKNGPRWSSPSTPEGIGFPDFLESGRHRAEPDRRGRGDPLRSLVEPRRPRTGYGPRPPDRPAIQRTGL